MKKYIGPNEMIVRISKDTGYKKEAIKEIFQKYSEIAISELDKGFSVSCIGVGILYYKLMTAHQKAENGEWIKFKMPRIKIKQTIKRSLIKNKKQYVNQETVEILLEQARIKLENKKSKQEQIDSRASMDN